MTPTIKRAAEALCFAVDRMPRHKWATRRTGNPTASQPETWGFDLECRDCLHKQRVVVTLGFFGEPMLFFFPYAVPPCSLSLHLD